jgi:predicted RNA binding protein YcfA (HicA-like mRNA interferase family)
MVTRSTEKNVAINAIAFLDGNNALELDQVPWTTYSDQDDIASVDYQALMSDPRGDLANRSWAAPEDFVRKVQAALLSASEVPVAFPERTGRSRIPANTEWDAAAWYQPMHFFAADWGIFIREEMLLLLALEILKMTDLGALARERAKGLPPRGPKNFWQLGDAELFMRGAFVLLYLHEHFHHRVECLGLRLHVVTRTPLYVPYFRNVYQPALGTDGLLEESLANACMYRRLTEEAYMNALPEAIRTAMRAMLLARFPHDPPGYRKAIEYLTDQAFEEGENRLQGMVRETVPRPVQPTSEWDVAPRMTQSFFNLSSNIYTVVPKGTKSVLPTTIFPHSCSTQDMVRLCRRNGYEIRTGAGKGSHLKLEKAGSPVVVLPQRHDLSPGVIKNTLAAIGGYKLRDLPKLLDTI